MTRDEKLLEKIRDINRQIKNLYEEQKKLDKEPQKIRRNEWIEKYKTIIGKFFTDNNDYYVYVIDVEENATLWSESTFCCFDFVALENNFLDFRVSSEFIPKRTILDLSDIEILTEIPKEEFETKLNEQYKKLMTSPFAKEGGLK